MCNINVGVTIEAQVVIVPARRGDLDVIFAISADSFTNPWPREELQQELTRPFSGLRVLRPALGAPVVAFLSYWKVVDELQLMNIAVSPLHRRRGYGEALLADLVRIGRADAFATVMLEVRRSNVDAIRLYERCAFQSVGIRPRYYSDNNEDALVMRLALGSATHSKR
jgi:ribosomal-protein-alanine N-acetyltransferase